MSLFDYVAAAAGGWLVLAALGGTSWAFVATRAKRRRPTVVRATYPPPPPPPVRREADAYWLDAWPTAAQHVLDVDAVRSLLSEEELSDELVDRLFDDLIAIEGLDR